MAKLIEQDEDSKFPNPKIGKTPFLTSIRDFKPDGVKLGIESVSRVFPTKQDPSKAQITVELCIMDSMPKCRLYDLDENGEYITIKDEITGKEDKKIVLSPIEADDLEMFPLYLPCGKPKEINNEADLKFYPTSSAYPLFKTALINAGELPSDMGDKPFVTNQVELKDALEGFTFIGKAEEINGKYHYFRLLAEPVND